MNSRSLGKMVITKVVKVEHNLSIGPGGTAHTLGHLIDEYMNNMFECECGDYIVQSLTLSFSEEEWEGVRKTYGW